MIRSACFRYSICPASRRRLRHQRTTRVRPAERMREDAIEIIDEIYPFAAQISHRGERTSANHLPHDDAEDHLDLVQPRAVLRRIHEPDAVTRLRQERL